MGTDWNVNKILLMLATGSIVTAVLSLGTDFIFSERWVPFLPGVIAVAVLAFWTRPWLYLVAGALTATFPLVILFVFGAHAALMHPGVGADFVATLLLALAAVLALMGGVAGFVQGRRGTQPPGHGFVASSQGLAALLVLSLVAGAVLSSGLASADLRTMVTHSASNAVPDHIVELEMVDFEFSPKQVVIPAGEIVALKVKNSDKAFHTFTYMLEGERREMPIPGNTEVTILLRFAEPQAIHFWCAPHAAGEHDVSENAMWGTLVVQ